MKAVGNYMIDVQYLTFRQKYFAASWLHASTLHSSHKSRLVYVSEKMWEKISSNGQVYIWTRVILLEISMPNKRLLQLQIQALQVTECGYKK